MGSGTSSKGGILGTPQAQQSISSAMQVPNQQMPNYMHTQPATPLGAPGQRLAGREAAAGLPGVTSTEAMDQRRSQPLNQIGDMSFAQPAVMPPSGMFGQSAQRPQAMTIDEFARSGLMGPTTQEARNPVEYQGSMRDPELVRRYEAYTSGQTQQPMQQESSQDLMARMNQARQAGLQVGPTPNQPPNPYTGMSPVQLQQMNDMRMQQMQADAMRRQPPIFNPGMDPRPQPYSQPSQPYQRQSPFGMPMQQPMYQMPYQQQPYQMPYQMPMYQQPMYQQRVSPGMFGGLASLFGGMRGFF